MTDPKSNIKAMRPYSPPIEGRSSYTYRLDFNESVVGPPNEVIGDILDFIRSGRLHIYPEYGSLENDVAGFYGVKEEQAMVTNGSDQAIDVIIRTFAGKKDEVVIPTPSFAMFYQSAKVEGADIKEVLYNEDLSFPTEGVLDSIDANTRVVIICNPNNPTGTPVKASDIKEIVEKAGDSLVFIDEAYYDFNGQTSVDLIDDFENVVISRSFSKAFGLAALRAGCAISCEKNIGEMLKVRGPYDVNMCAKVGIQSAIRNYDKIKPYLREVMDESKPYLERELESLGFKVYPSSANFIVVRFGDGATKLSKKLKDSGVLVRDRSTYPLLKGCVRVSVGTLEYSRHFISTLKEAIR